MQIHEGSGKKIQVNFKMNIIYKEGSSEDKNTTEDIGKCDM